MPPNDFKLLADLKSSIQFENVFYKSASK